VGAGFIGIIFDDLDKAQL